MIQHYTIFNYLFLTFKQLLRHVHKKKFRGVYRKFTIINNTKYVNK